MMLKTLLICSSLGLAQVPLSTRPRVPLIERDASGQYLNFDLVFRNARPYPVVIAGIELAVYSPRQALLLKKSLNQNGRSPSITVIGRDTVGPGETVCIFNPFDRLGPAIPIGKMIYTFYLDRVGDKIKRLPFDADEPLPIVVKPKLYRTRTRQHLPLKGRLLVWDGHDLYAHHRRFPLGLPALTAAGITANSNRYAFDFNRVDKKGNLFHGDWQRKENWYVYGQPVFAPGSGIVLASVNDIPDNSYRDKQAVIPPGLERKDSLGMGNYVIIDHRNGEYSVLLHLEAGSVRLKKGDPVRPGQQIGRVGFSGDAINPHLHYTLLSGPYEEKDEGVPSYFFHYALMTGKGFSPVKHGRVDSGDILYGY